jgi:hypothetical protein
MGAQSGGAGLEEWSAWHGVSPLEMLCSISGRLPTFTV